MSKIKIKRKLIKATTNVKTRFAKEVDIQVNADPLQSAVERSGNALNILRKTRGY